MKKLKIMLMSFAILAIIGGALAFNAKTVNNYCTTTTNGQAANFCTVAVGINTTCPIIDPGKPGIVGLHPVYCYTTDQDAVFDCKNADKSAFLRCLDVPTTLTTVD